MAAKLPLEGEVFRGWLLEKALDQGNSGVVFRASNNGARRALKIFFPEKIEVFGAHQELERLDRQLTLIGHECPFLVRIFDGGRDDTGLYFLSMELVEGAPLHKVLDQIQANQVGRLIAQVAQAALFLEQRGFCHRDIKPDNIIVSGSFENATLLDVGVLRPLDRGESASLSGGEFVGTTRYSPPEFVLKAEVNTNPDALRAITFYQLGATLHDMIMKRRIFSDFEKPKGRLYHAIQTVTPVIASTEVPEAVTMVARKALLKNWEERLSVVSWDSFLALGDQRLGTVSARERIEQVQIERRQSERLQLEVVRQEDVTAMWILARQMQNSLQQALQEDPIYPRFTTSRGHVRLVEHSLSFEFDADGRKGVPIAFKVTIGLRPAVAESALAAVTMELTPALATSPTLSTKTVVPYIYSALPKDVIQFFEQSLAEVMR